MSKRTNPAAADDDPLSMVGMFRRMNADADRRMAIKQKHGCCGEFDNCREDGFCRGIGWCPSHEMARQILADLFGEE